jgi:tRNA pseudouridine55 synthase
LKDGVIILDKPAGITSFRAVQLVGRAVREKKCGHAGTLDPMATGVLPVCVGKATRIAGYLTGLDKEYVVEFRFGLSTDTGDVEGKEVESAPGAFVPEEALRGAVSRLVGTWDQVPPAYSAVKVGGMRAYKLARRGEAPELAPRTVTVTEAELLGWSEEAFRLRVACSKGFYVRSIARDFGAEFAVPMTVSSLRRTRCGVLGEAMAVPLETLQEEGARGEADRRLLTTRQALADFPCYEIPQDAVAAVRQGRSPAAWLVGASAGPRGVALLVDGAASPVALVSPAPSGEWKILRGM